MKRRRFLGYGVASGAVLVLPWAPGCEIPLRDPPARFLDAERRAVVEALADALVPEDETIGAVRAGAVSYIDSYLAAFDNVVPNLFARGPFSGRAPFPSAQTGGPSKEFPPDGLATYRPLTRMQELAFRIELYGSDAVPGGDRNAPIVPPWPGLRRLYREATDTLSRWAAAGGHASFAAAPAVERLGAYAKLPKAFQEAFGRNIAEGMFAAPEYGGNTDTMAWQDYQWSGDRQPLGHTLIDPQTGALRDDPEQPNQARDPRWPGSVLEPSVEKFIEVIATVTGGRRFS